MRVIEKFVSINGEGLRQGELAVFIRFANCNLRCSYCDTTYSFINPVYNDESIDEIIDYINKQHVKNITLTGGEPLIQEDIDILIKRLVELGYRVEIETNGSVDIKKYLNDKISFTLDYKLPTSLMEKFMLTDNYDYVTKKDSIKFVCGDLNDLIKAKEIMIKYNLINKTNCLISPVFNQINLEDIVNFLIDNNLNDVRLCLQIHKIIWDPNKRGV
ncbi:MAG: putative 7-carboxy-7-deazaguanine synthase QueE [Acholeplasmatales bacterium]|nr:putative 7-carboxy-7-deazaguanine synthase QueE [Acholeplasmatales bacterium]